MRTKILTATLILVSLLSLAFAYQPTQPKWEYKTEAHGTMSEKKLNELGAQGWELVTVAKEPTQLLQTFYFKRPQN